MYRSVLSAMGLINRLNIGVVTNDEDGFNKALERKVKIEIISVMLSGQDTSLPMHVMLLLVNTCLTYRELYTGNLVHV